MGNFLKAFVATALLTVGSASAWANTNWTVSGLFDDNASVGGTITWDNNAPLSWHLETTVGSSLVFPAIYDSTLCAPGNSAGCGSNATLFNPGEWSFDNPDQMQLTLMFNPNLFDTIGIDVVPLTVVSNESVTVDNLLFDPDQPISADNSPTQSYFRNIVTGTATATAVAAPEPASLAVLGAGLIGLALGRRRKF